MVVAARLTTIELITTPACELTPTKTSVANAVAAVASAIVLTLPSLVSINHAPKNDPGAPLTVYNTSADHHQLACQPTDRHAALTTGCPLPSCYSQSFRLSSSAPAPG